MTNKENFNYVTCACAAALFLGGGGASADIIASQDFNSLDDSATETFDMVTNGSPLTNASSANVGGPGMDFTSTWFDTMGNTTGPVAGSDTSDFIGVNSFAGSNAPDFSPDGTAVSSGVEHNFEFNDIDGRIDLVFETIDVSSYENIQFSLYFLINDTGYESEDSFVVLISDGINEQAVLDFDDSELEAYDSVDDSTPTWWNLSVDISDLIDNQGFGTNLTLTVRVDNNSGAENIFIDDVAFTGDFIPAPGALALLGLAGLAGVRRRRRCV